MDVWTVSPRCSVAFRQNSQMETGSFHVFLPFTFLFVLTQSFQLFFGNKLGPLCQTDPNSTRTLQVLLSEQRAPHGGDQLWLALRAGGKAHSTGEKRESQDSAGLQQARDAQNMKKMYCSTWDDGSKLTPGVQNKPLW